jgi:hypothetical protein
MDSYVVMVILYDLSELYLVCEEFYAVPLSRGHLPSRVAPFFMRLWFSHVCPPRVNRFAPRLMGE